MLRRILCFAAAAAAVNGLSLPAKRRGAPPQVVAHSRRSALGLAVAAAVAAAAPPAVAAEEEEIEVYFGCGCFWHVQHEFVEAERRILGRKDAELTALSGYAAGLAGAKNDKVCYHNAAMISDYGSLGHAEAVRLRIPPSSFGEFAKEYCKLFDAKGNRPDQSGDRGPEYRNIVGVPGGSSGPYAKALVAASVASGDKLDFATGKGDDADVRALAFVMDSTKFPFYAAEPYHRAQLRTPAPRCFCPAARARG